MTKLGVNEIVFPDDMGEAKRWRPTTRYRALHTQILAVAKSRVEGRWSAYIAPVPGMHHDEEYEDVLKHGTKLSESIALAMFPYFEGVPYAR